MKQATLYKRDISKDIDGVVKAADLNSATLLDEINEYVLTNELMRANMLPRLFEELSNVSFNKSIWISGHFGSGKSHLLKILSLVLADTKLNEQSSAQIFAKKCSSDFELGSAVSRTAGIPTETILFNIQAKNDGITSSSADPVLAVFAKVFNEHLGYNTNPKIADFERYLDDKGVYSTFKELYFKQTNEPWEKGRERILLNPTKCAEVFAQIENISKEEAINGIRDFTKNYTLDSEIFAKLVSQYIQRKGSNARLIFCVDEVGQYIAEDTEKMLSLQTITESISNLTAGRAFTIVTSQNDLTATVGDFNKKQKNDFSKITGRFAFKIALTSANADEVIQKRLLAKTDDAARLLSDVYSKESNNLKTILKFEGETPFNIKYKDVEHFVNTYPFIAYQFDLLQSAIGELHKNNAFIGSHQSLGERSMLSICQKVIQGYAQAEYTQLVSFGAMYDGLTDMFQSNVISDITQANKLIENKFAVEVLKALFLVKYEKRLKTTVDNIAILMLPSFDIDLVQFKKQIQEALNILENNTYIQRTATGVYEYLTNQEKDIENEIKNTDIESGAAQRMVQTVLFGELYNLPKIQIGASKYQLFEYGKKCDGNLNSQEKDIYLHFITPLCGDEIIRNNIKNYSMGNSMDLIVVLPENPKLSDDIILYEQTKKYISTTHPMEHEALKFAIIADKRAKNEERSKVIVDMIMDGVAQSTMYIFGNEVSSTTQNIKDRITQGLTELIGSAYTNLRMLQMEYTEESISKAMAQKDDLGLNADLSEAENEILSKLQRNKANHERTTVKSLLAVFRSRPYGWYNNAILSLIAGLCKRGKALIKRDGNVLNDSEVVSSLLNSRSYDNTIIEIEDVISPSQISRLKGLFQDYFGKPCTATEGREISSAFTTELREYADKLEDYYRDRSEMKFLECLREPLDFIRQLSSRTHPYFFTNISTFEDRLLDDKEYLLDKIDSFMSGSQRDIFHQMSQYIKSNSANLSYLSEGHIEKLREIYNSSTPYVGNAMQQAKQSLDAMKTELTSLQESERVKALAKVSEYREKITLLADFTTLGDIDKQHIIEEFDKAQTEISGNRFIANMRERASYIADEYYTMCLEKVAYLQTPVTPVSPNGDTSSTEYTQTIKKRITYVNRNSVKVSFGKPTLDSKEDVEAYIETLKQRYMELIDEDKRISL